MALFPAPFEALLGMQQALEALRSSDWLDPGPSGGGGYPPINVFRRGEDFAIIVELPGVEKSGLEIQVRGKTIRLSGTKTVSYPERAALHRRERLAGRFDRALTLPIEIDAEGVQAEYRDGILALLLRRSERDKAKTIQVK
jgi:HSP20 family protein